MGVVANGMETFSVFSPVQVEMPGQCVDGWGSEGKSELDLGTWEFGART